MEKTESKRNLVRQEIINPDGSKNIVFHTKKFNRPEYGNKKEWWDMVNKMPKPNSKRQRRLKLLAP